MLKSLLSAFNLPREHLSQHFWVIFAGMAWKLKNVGSTYLSFNPCQSLPSVATEDRKQFQCLDTALKNIPGPLFLESN